MQDFFSAHLKLKGKHNHLQLSDQTHLMVRGVFKISLLEPNGLRNSCCEFGEDDMNSHCKSYHEKLNQ